MKKLAILAVALGLATPAVAQQAALPGAERPRPVQQQTGVGRGAPVNGVLVLYGNEKCPTNSDGDEIVICEHRSAQEQYRVPKELRDLQITPENQSWAVRAQDTLSAGVGVNGIGSCSPVGPGGATGCFGQAARANRAINKARKAEETPAD
ncbi:hypothetical protein Q5H91_12615 [Sphingomonas sp. KR1UV-12]|uniref:Uncharacterized protein n=1 Tax=Sphingomonas aurea TaxID=3063994 RepID=A0ABT9EM83_9SPHN|nr:hypothetical protein [Sphingomonas sp. KR1UV-12]MDP1028059.1 hypothetical protein [Sphingomonas sp. KR1UV-12]